ncbi:MAG: MFS transporter [Candidatus Dormibacteria bacterium]
MTFRLPLSSFARLCTAEAISRAGTRVTLLALPVTAVLVLHKGPIATASLVAAEGIPVLLLGLPAGAWIDRRRRRPILVTTALLRALVLLSIPLAALLGALSLAQLLLVAGLVGALAIFGDIGSWTLMPDLVEEGRVLEAMGRMQSGVAAAEIAGPGVGALLIQAFGAPFAILADAASYLISAFFVAGVHEPPRAAPVRPAPSLRAGIREGLALVRRSPVLIHCVCGVATYAFFAELTLGIYPVFVLTTLHTSALVLGLALAANGVGALASAFVSGVVGRNSGVGRSVGLFVGVSTVGTMVTALAQGPFGAVVLLLLVGQFGAGLGGIAMAANTAALRQSLAPPGTLARVNSIARFLGFVAAPLGAAVGGLLSVGLSVREAIIISAIGQGVAAAWLLASPVQRFRLQRPTGRSPRPAPIP